ncbi:MAG: transposase [Spirochaetaceae bacterium]|nr:transposase [Spirochaetaceae bacterium]
MYKEESGKQQKLEDFYLPFGGHLDEENRWIILSKKVPWEKIENDYKEKLSGTGFGAPAKPLRMALGALIIKEKLQISDREVVEQIRETPYLQYFIGLEGYEDKEPFDPSMMVHFRKRLDGQLIQKTNEILFREHREEELKKKRQIRKKLKKQKG